MAIKIVATRVPPGDRWVLTNEVSDDHSVLPSLTDALNTVYQITDDRIFTIDAIKGEIQVDSEIQDGPRKWDLYGEYGDDKSLLQG